MHDILSTQPVTTCHVCTKNDTCSYDVYNGESKHQEQVNYSIKYQFQHTATMLHPRDKIYAVKLTLHATHSVILLLPENLKVFKNHSSLNIFCQVFVVV